VAAYTQAELLAIINRLFPQSWLAPLRDPGPGYEAIQAQAAGAARVSEAAANAEAALYVTTAPFGALATTTVAFTRASAAAGAVTVLRGTVLRARDSELRFVLQEDVVFGALDLAGTPAAALVQAEYQSEAYNVAGPTVSAAGAVTPGQIDQIEVALQDPPFGDPSIVVAQLATATGGASPWLELHGFDRGLVRKPGETADDFRYRLQIPAEVVTPNAIRAVVEAALQPWGVTAVFIDLSQPSYLPSYDMPPGGLYGDLLCYDDPRPAPPFRCRYLTPGYDEVLAFYVYVPPMQPVRDTGCYDDVAMVAPGDFISPLQPAQGVRAVQAYDLTAQSYAGIPAGCYDGADYGLAGVLGGLYEQIQAIRAAGVYATLVR